MSLRWPISSDTCSESDRSDVLTAHCSGITGDDERIKRTDMCSYGGIVLHSTMSTCCNYYPRCKRRKVKEALLGFGVRYR